MRYFLENFWSKDVQIFRILLGLFIFWSAHAIRKISKFYYVPTYFVIFPLSMLDRSFAQYFGEDDWGVYDLDLEKRKQMKNKLKLMAIVTTFLSLLIIPATLGFFIAFFLRRTDLWVFLLFLIIWRGEKSWESVVAYYRWQESPNNFYKYLTLFYFFYITTLYLVVKKSYFFTIQFVESGNWGKFISELEDFAFSGILFTILVGIISSILANWLLKKDSIRWQRSVK